MLCLSTASESGLHYLLGDGDGGGESAMWGGELPHQDVLTLEVSIDDVEMVEVLECLGNLHTHTHTPQSPRSRFVLHHDYITNACFTSLLHHHYIIITSLHT